MPWPAHLAQDVRFDHVAAVRAADALRDLAAALDRHATDRAQDLAAADHFRGRARATVDTVAATLSRRTSALVARLHTEAARVEVAADEARRDAATLAARRERWLVDQRRAAARRGASDEGQG